MTNIKSPVTIFCSRDLTITKEAKEAYYKEVRGEISRIVSETDQDGQEKVFLLKLVKWKPRE